MQYNFDEIIERRGTDSVKWDGVQKVWGRNDLLPMWVADMDFRTPPFVMDALRKRLDHAVLGYTFACEEWYTSICNWLHRRHQWDISRAMLTFVPGIVRGQAFALQCFTRPGDKVMVMTPVYHPFFFFFLKYPLPATMFSFFSNGSLLPLCSIFSLMVASGSSGK